MKGISRFCWNPRIDGDMKQQILDHLNLVGEATIQAIATELNFNAGLFVLFWIASNAKIWSKKSVDRVVN